MLSAAAAVTAAVASGVRPLVLELVDGATLGAVHALEGTRLQEASGPAVERRGRVLIEDVAVPLSWLAHAGDGDLHPLIAVPRAAGAEQDDDEAPLPPEVLAAADTARELGPDVVALQHQLKAVLDPSGIMNPHKAL